MPNRDGKLASYAESTKNDFNVKYNVKLSASDLECKCRDILSVSDEKGVG